MAGTYHYKRSCSILLLAAAWLLSCRKDHSPPAETEEIVSPVTGTRREFTLDSIYLYARQIYLWNEALPSYTVFNPRVKYATHYSSDLAAFKAELFDISQLQVNPLTNLPYESPLYSGSAKYSYLETGTTAGRTATATTDNTITNPVLATAILEAGGLTVGYICLSSFPRLSLAQNYLDAAFVHFAASNMAYLVVDLRSNSGGYVETAEYMANLIAPSTLNGKVMFTEQFNSQMQLGKALILRHQPYLDENNMPVNYKGRAATMADVDFTEAGNTYTFQKKGNLQCLKNVYFIVSGKTASASELLINCLKPYLNVKLAGTRTYGKPVGFFGVTIDKYTCYLSGFLIKNALGSADYFDGMHVDINAEADEKYELGNPNETCLSRVLADIQVTKANPKTSFKTVSSLKTPANTTSTAALPSANTSPVPDGMIEHRIKLK